MFRLSVQIVHIVWYPKLPNLSPLGKKVFYCTLFQNTCYSCSCLKISALPKDKFPKYT
jgi:hypothetical protein